MEFSFHKREFLRENFYFGSKKTFRSREIHFFAPKNKSSPEITEFLFYNRRLLRGGTFFEAKNFNIYRKETL